MKTTPGPWIARHNGHFWEVGTSLAEFAHSVAHVPQSAFMPGDAEANARLLASAPDLLAERDKLKALNVELVAALRRLIGQTSNIEVLGEWSVLDMNITHSKRIRALVDADIALARAALAKNKETT